MLGCVLHNPKELPFLKILFSSVTFIYLLGVYVCMYMGLHACVPAHTWSEDVFYGVDCLSTCPWGHLSCLAGPRILILRQGLDV